MNYSRTHSIVTWALILTALAVVEHLTGGKCAQVAIGSGAIIAATAIGLITFYNRTLRKFTGLEFILRRLPMQRQVSKAIETMELYRKHWLAVVWAVLMTIPVHGTVVLSAMFAGMAFGLPMHWQYYWVAVPVIVLSGAIPISPPVSTWRTL